MQNIPIVAYVIIGFAILHFLTSFIKEKFFSSSQAGAPDETDIEYVRERAREVVRFGAGDYAEMFESVEDAALDSGLSSSAAAEFLDEEIAILLEEQKSWPEVTEVDRLRLAFESLQARGYHTDFGEICCGSCGSAGARAAMKKNPELHGRVFFTTQDIDGALLGRPIDFWYGAPGRKHVESKDMKVAQDLFECLKEQGLTPDWDGTSKDQIRLPINWQVRLDDSRAQAT